MRLGFSGIKGRLATLIVVPSLISTGVVVYNRYSDRVTENIIDTTFEQMKAADILQQISRDRAQLTFHVVGYERAVLKKESDRMKFHYESIQSTKAQLTKSIAEFDSIISDATIKTLWLNFTKAAEEYQKLTSEFMESMSIADFAGAGKIVDGPMEVATKTMLSALDQVIAKNRSFTEAQKLRAIRNLEFADIISLVLGLAGLSITIGFGMAVARRTHGELKNSVLRLATAGDSVQTASQEMESASHQIYTSSASSAQSLQSTARSVEDLAATVRESAANARAAADQASSSSKEAMAAEAGILGLTQAMHEIAVSSKKIEEIIAVIDDIAFQTNLLALNAAVEAAAAGEQGKGFAVVAEAVRNLAQRSALAAKDITTMIKDTVAKINSGQKLVDNNSESLKKILASVIQVSNFVGEIAESGERQAAGIAGISQTIQQIDQSTRASSQTAKNASSNAQKLSQQSTMLKEIVGEIRMVAGQ